MENHQESNTPNATVDKNQTLVLNHDIILTLDVEGREDDPCIKIHDPSTKAHDYIYKEHIDDLKSFIAAMESALKNHENKINQH